MTTRDDRQEFEAHKRDMSTALGKDEAAFRQAIDMVVTLDKFDYPYLWSWMGVPIIQMPADILATQEVIWQTRPDVIIETGVARGGSVIFQAAMLQLIGKGKVVGVDIDIRAHNRDSIEKHTMASRIELIEGPSTSADTMARVKSAIPAGASVMVILDSDHSYDHVIEECRTYGPLVTEGCYLVVADTVVGYIPEDNPLKTRSKTWRPGNEPLSALQDYLKETDRFEVDEILNGKLVISSSPNGYCRCVK